MGYFIPKDTSELLKRNNLEVKDIDNFSLRLNRFTRIHYGNRDKYEFNIRDIKGSTNIDLNRIEKYYERIKNIYLNNLSILATNNWRLAIGIGSSSVYETSITLHHIYGVPYIPAQSIKGSLRSFIIQKYFFDELKKYDKYNDFEQDELYKKEKDNKKYKHQWFIDIFGSNEQQGKVIFFDAFTKESKIQLDIMNNHYQKYYNGSESPTDTQNPNPINFLTLKGSKFEIVIATKESIVLESENFKGDILDCVKDKLYQSLEIFGIGAKTSAGYGYFDIQKSEEEKAWDRVEDTEDIKTIENFIKNYSTSKNIEKAKNKIEKIKEKIEIELLKDKDKESINEWERIIKNKKYLTADRIRQFINKYPISSKKEEAQKELESMNSSKTKAIPKGLDFSQAKDAKSIERAMKFIQNPTNEDKQKLEDVIKRVYPNLNAKKKKQFKKSKLMIRWLGKERFDAIIS